MVVVNSVAKKFNIPENGNVVRLTKEDIEKILLYAKNELPNEACGLLGGVIENDITVIKKICLLKNIDESREHFTMDTKEQLAAVKDMRAKGLKPVGCWHSHPESMSRPSKEDIRLAHDSDIIYFILSLRNEKAPVLNAFAIKNHADVSAYTIQVI